MQSLASTAGSAAVKPRVPGTAVDVFLREALTIAPHTVRTLPTGRANVDAATREGTHTQRHQSPNGQQLQRWREPTTQPKKR